MSSSRAGVAFVDIEGDFDKLDADVKQALADTARKLDTLPDVTVDGDFSGATSAANRAVGNIDSAVASVPDVDVDGDFSGVERGARVISGVESDIRGIPDADVDGDFSGLEEGADDAVGGVELKMDSLKSVAKGGAASAGAAGAAALGYAFTQALSLEQSEDKLAAQLGLTGKQAERAGDIAGDLWSNAYGESIEEVQGAFSDVFRNIGDLSEGAMKRATASSLNLAQAFGADSAEITRAVGGLIKNGLAKNTREAFDLITAGFQQGADQGGEFLDTLNEYAQPVKDLGLSAKDFTGILVEGLDNGVYSVDKIGDALKEFQIRVVDGSEATKTAFTTIGLDADDMASKFAKGGESAKNAMSETIQAIKSLHDPVAQERAGVGLFGSMWEDIGKKAILGMDPAVDRLGKVDGAAKKLDKTIGDNLMTRFESFKRKALLELVRILMDDVIPAIEDAVDFVKDFEGAFESAEAIIVPYVKAIGAAVGDLAGVIGGELKIIKGILTGDFGEIWEGVKDIFRNGKDFILDTLKAITAPARVIAKEIGEKIMDGISKVADLPGKMADWLGKGLDKLVGFLDGFKDKATQLGNRVVSGVMDGMSDLVSKIADRLSSGVDKITAFFDSALNKATTLGSKIVSGVGSGLGDLVDKIGDKVSAGVSKIGDFFEQAYSKAETLGGKIVNGLKAAIEGVGTTISNAIAKAITGVASVAKGVLNYFVDALNNAIPNSIAIPHAPDINLPDNPIPHFADGVRNFAGGLAMVGEEGPELVNLPRGADVLPAPQTAQMVNRLSAIEGGTPDVNLFIEGDASALDYRIVKVSRGEIAEANRLDGLAWRATGLRT